MKLKEVFEKNKLACIFVGVSIVLSLVSLILYLAAGTNKFNTGLSPSTIIAFILCILVGGVQVVLAVLKGKTMPIVCFGQYAVGLYGCASYIVTQRNLIGNVMYGIMNPGSGDGNTLGAAMIITTLFSLLAWVFSLVAAIMLQKKEKKELVAEQKFAAEKE